MRRTIALGMGLLLGFTVTVAGVPGIRGTILASASTVQVGVRDVGPAAGLPVRRHSWSVLPYDIDHDGWMDLTISHHGQEVSIWHNDHAGGVSLGLVKMTTLHASPDGWADPHACDWADVNGDRLDDVFCATGASSGTAKKKNQLWIQGPAWTFTDRAYHWGVLDVWGRGRHPAFLDLNHDKWPDLFVGNDYPRLDDHHSPNRTYVNVNGERFKQVRLGITHEVGAECAQVADVNSDGWQDLLVCGNEGLRLYIRRPGSGFVDRRAAYGITTEGERDALLADVNRDGRRDLVALGGGRVLVQLRRHDGTFARVSTSRAVTRGHGVAVGNLDGRRGADIYVVRACANAVNVPDLLLMNEGNGRDWIRNKRLPGLVSGCGDVAASLDFDRDGRDDLVVLNGGYLRYSDGDQGPDQLLTTGSWKPPA
jgi:hypothetical protein